MSFPRLSARIAALAAALLLAGCGGGGSPGDIVPGTEPAPTPEGNPDSFLLFPNPQVQPDGSLQTDTLAYAQAYYAAIDPTNAKDTLAKWKAANGFDADTGTQVTAVFGDQRDLGYGRRMTGRQNADGTIAFFVENYIVKVGAAYAFSGLNLEAAIVRDPKFLLGVSAIEFSPGPAGGAPFVKFYNFSAANGAREYAVDLDGHGAKAMPGPCLTCHGGRADALTPPDASGKPRFSLLRGTASGARGDVTGRLPPIEVGALQFSTASGFSRAEQEATLKTMNRLILCTYPLPEPSTFPEDACRAPAKNSEWQGTAATLVKEFYGGDGLPNANFADSFVPPSWQEAGQSALYTSVVVPACRSCHIVRGTGAQSDIDFATFEKFQSYAGDIRAFVFDRGNMPLARIVYDAFWDSGQNLALATFLESEGFSVRDATGAVLRPGRPIADPGPDRVVRQGASRLSAAGSLFSNEYAWTIVSGPNGAVPPTGATLSGASSAQPVFSATTDGTFVLSLVASRGALRSAPASVKLVVDSALAPAPGAIRFADINAVLAAPACTACHSPTFSQPPPIFFTDDDRDGDGTAGSATDDAWLYDEVRSRVNFAAIATSPLLRKPAGSHHRGGRGPGFDTTAEPGQPERTQFDLFLNWILDGAPR